MELLRALSYQKYIRKQPKCGTKKEYKSESPYEILHTIYKNASFNIDFYGFVMSASAARLSFKYFSTSTASVSVTPPNETLSTIRDHV